MSRALVDNRRYYLEGGQAGLRRSGLSDGVRLLCGPAGEGELDPPSSSGDVVAELANLVDQGIGHVHTCDSEFNVPEIHALEICEGIIRRGIGDRLRWYAYCKPGPFRPSLPGGCADPAARGSTSGGQRGRGMLSRLGRDFGPSEILSAAAFAGKRDRGHARPPAGGPGGNPEEHRPDDRADEAIGADRIGVTVGVRVYPGTRLAMQVLKDDLRDGLVGGSDFSQPVFFLEPGIAPTVYDQLDALVGKDPGSSSSIPTARTGITTTTPTSSSSARSAKGIVVRIGYSRRVTISS